MNSNFININFYRPNGRLFAIFIRVAGKVFCISNPFHKWG